MSAAIGVGVLVIMAYLMCFFLAATLILTLAIRLDPMRKMGFGWSRNSIRRPLCGSRGLERLETNLTELETSTRRLQDGLKSRDMVCEHLVIATEDICECCFERDIQGFYRAVQKTKDEFKKLGHDV